MISDRRKWDNNSGIADPMDQRRMVMRASLIREEQERTCN